MNLMKNQKLIYLALILLGIAGAIFSQYYSGFGAVILENYGANFFFPFAIYFIIRNFPLERSTVALIALGGVLLQEIAQLLGLYAGIFDYKDLLVDIAGVLAAMMVDRKITRIKHSKVHSVSQ
jgi:glycopeptide antibiotics resistance protein